MESRILPQADFETEDFTVLLLDEGAGRCSVDAAELQRLLNAYLGWMLALAGSGELLTAGALLDSGKSPRVTGLGFSRLPAQELAVRAALDPAVAAGVERVRVVAYRLPKGSISFSSAPNEAQSRRLYEEVFGRGNLQVADEIMASDVVGHGPGTPPVTGTDQIKTQAARLPPRSRTSRPSWAGRSPKATW